MLCISNQFSAGYWSQKKLSSVLKPYPQCTLVFFKLFSLLIKCLSTNSSKVFPNHWLSFVIPTTQKWHPHIKQSFACLRNLKELCPRFILLFDALKQNYFKVFLSVERWFCRSYIRSCNCNLIILLLSFLKKVLLIQLYKKTQQNKEKNPQKKAQMFSSYIEVPCSSKKKKKWREKHSTVTSQVLAATTLPGNADTGAWEQPWLCHYLLAAQTQINFSNL